MLVLTRRPGEQIVIGNGIRVTVVSVGPGRVKIGIEAPENVRIDRQEVHDKIVREQADAGSDVLAEVGRGVVSDEASPTIVAGGDTSTTMHNRITDRFPAPVVPPRATTPGKYQTPRKSR